MSWPHASSKGDAPFAPKEKIETCLVMTVKPIDSLAVLTKLLIGSSMVTPFPVYRPRSRTCIVRKICWRMTQIGRCISPEPVRMVVCIHARRLIVIKGVHKKLD
jgi:hypothetical protein